MKPIQQEVCNDSPLDKHESLQERLHVAVLSKKMIIISALFCELILILALGSFFFISYRIKPDNSTFDTPVLSHTPHHHPPKHPPTVQMQPPHHPPSHHLPPPHPQEHQQEYENPQGHPPHHQPPPTRHPVHYQPPPSPPTYHQRNGRQPDFVSPDRGDDDYTSMRERIRQAQAKALQLKLRQIQNLECSELTRAEQDYRFLDVNETKEQIWNGITPDNLVNGQPVNETDYVSYLSRNRESFVRMNYFDSNDLRLDEWKQEMNNLNFVMNKEKFNESVIHDRKQHLPIWLRVFMRTDPLKKVLTALCSVNSIENAILYVTVDGSHFLQVLDELSRFKCIKTRIYFHSFHHNLKSYLGDQFQDTFLKKRTTKLVTHAMYGLNLLFNKFHYPYVISLEDDIGPLPDFFNYHLSLYNLTLDDSPSNPYYSIQAYAHGSRHHCKYISSSLFQEGIITDHGADALIEKCRFKDVDHLVLEQYHAIWGSGIPRKLFNRLWNVWTRAVFSPDDTYLGTMLRDLRKPNERSVSPCSNRITRYENHGENGREYRTRFWTISEKPSTFYQNTESVKNWKPNQRTYKMLND